MQNDQENEGISPYFNVFQIIFGSIYNFTPKTYSLPNEYRKFVEEFTKQDSKSIWICKPTDMSRGRKIFLINNIKDLQYDQ